MARPQRATAAQEAGGQQGRACGHVPTHSVQLHVEPAGVAHRLPLCVPPPQRGRGGVAVGTAEAGSAGRGLRDQGHRVSAWPGSRPGWTPRGHQGWEEAGQGQGPQPLYQAIDPGGAHPWGPGSRGGHVAISAGLHPVVAVASRPRGRAGHCRLVPAAEDTPRVAQCPSAPPHGSCRCPAPPS